MTNEPILTRVDVKRLFYELSVRYSDKYGKNAILSFTPLLPIGQGFTANSLVSASHSFIGVGSMFDAKSKSKSNIIPFFEFVKCIMTTFHESKHVDQMYQDFSSVTSFGKYLAVNHLATRDNLKYYFSNEPVCINYLNNPREIDSNIYMIYNGYEYFKSVFPDVDSEKIICDYVNSRLNVGNFCGLNHRNNYTDMDSLMSDMIDVLNKSAHRQREYKLDSRHRDILNNKVEYTLYDDAPLVLLNLPTWDKVHKKFESISNAGFEQDKMVASLTLLVHSEWKQQYKALDDVDLSFEHVFGMKLPPIPEKFQQDLGIDLSKREKSKRPLAVDVIDKALQNFRGVKYDEFVNEIDNRYKDV